MDSSGSTHTHQNARTLFYSYTSGGRKKSCFLRLRKSTNHWVWTPKKKTGQGKSMDACIICLYIKRCYKLYIFAYISIRIFQQKFAPNSTKSQWLHPPKASNTSKVRHERWFLHDELSRYVTVTAFLSLNGLFNIPVHTGFRILLSQRIHPRQDLKWEDLGNSGKSMGNSLTQKGSACMFSLSDPSQKKGYPSGN